MRGLWIRLLRGGGRSAWFEAGFPVVASAFITVVLLFILGLQQGLEHRSERTAWRSAEASRQPTAVQASYLDYVNGRPVTFVELAQLTPERPDLPGMGDFPEPGEVWVSPALRELTATLPADQLADRLPAKPSRVLAQDLLEFPEDLVAVIGRSESDAVMHDKRPPHQWDTIASQSPVRIDSWSRTPDIHRATYEDLMMIAAVMLALPLFGLGGLAARLIASRRNRRMATLRLIGGTAGQVSRLTLAEVSSLVAVGAVAGLVLNLLVSRFTQHTVIREGSWYDGDLQLGAGTILILVAAVVAVMSGGALLGLRAVVSDPLGVVRRQRAQVPRAWGLLVAVVGVVVFWVRSANLGLAIVFTALTIVGLVVLASGPLVVAALGRLLGARARTVATLLVGRRLADDPRGGWRTVSGMVLAAFAAGFLAVGIPLGLGLVEDTSQRGNRIQVVVPDDSADRTADRISAELKAAQVDATVEAGHLPSWLDGEEWAALDLVVEGPGSERERARTAITSLIPGHAAVGADDENLANIWVVRDATVLAVVVLSTSVLVAITSMVVGALARVLDQRDTLTSLRLAGTPLEVLESAQRREMMLPTLVLGGLAALAGMATGLVAGIPNLLNLYSAAMIAGLIAVGLFAVLLADRIARPVLRTATADLSERE